MSDSPPLAIAHRGFPWVAPENTMISYKLAMQAGARVAECDVHLSADGVPVIIHDQNLERTTGVERDVGELTVSELKKLDAGSWKDNKFAGETIPTLAEALEFVKGKMRFIIEVKARGMETPVLEAIQSVGVEHEELMVISFDYDTVKNVAQTEKRLPTAFLIEELGKEGHDREAFIQKALHAKTSGVGLSKDHVDVEFVELAHKNEFDVFVYTANKLDDMRHLVRIGVDGIISDRVDLLLGVLKDRA